MSKNFSILKLTRLKQNKIEAFFFKQWGGWGPDGRKRSKKANGCLLVLCTAFRARTDRYPNLTVKKIPKQVLSRCEWGHDDYSLRVENLPKASLPKGQLSLFDEDES